MALFDSGIINVEGGYTCGPQDAGGATKYGISQRSYPHVDIKSLTVEDAIAIYERDYWNKYNLSQIRSQMVANLLFLLIVNEGPEPAIKLVQTAADSLIKSPILTIDGVIGPNTIQAINLLDELNLSNAIRVAECRYYLDLVDNHPSQDIFFKGWIRRALM